MHAPFTDATNGRLIEMPEDPDAIRYGGLCYQFKAEWTSHLY